MAGTGSAGVAFVFAAGTASGTTVRSGGYLVVLPHGTQSATTGTIVPTGI
jgi:autotransporter passenger strand-loop-strand repeat protein